MRPRALPSLVAAAALLGPASPPAAEPPAPRRVLFVGNSLTTAYDLPGMVAALSRGAGDDPPLETETVAFGGFALEDHAREGSARAAIERGGWSFVVLQQGPSSQPDSRRNLVGESERIAARIRAAGARPVLYMVWPSRARSADFPGVAASYRRATERVDGLLAPAGEAWRAAWKRDPSLELYGEDGFHPSPLGTYLAAVTVYSALSGRAPQGLPAALEMPWGKLSLPAELAARLQAAAAEALAAEAGR